MTRVISIEKVKQEHLIECPAVSLEFFMEHYCKNTLKDEKIDAIEVIVSPRFKFTYSKSEAKT